MTFAYTAVTLWSVHTDLPQPIAANALFSSPLSNPEAQQWHFDYAETEQVLAQVKFNNRGELLVNPRLANILTQAVESLPKNMSDKALQRLGFLVSKGLSDTPTAAGIKLPTLLINYYHLHYAEKEQLKTTDKLATFQARFSEKVELQNHYLGNDIANQFFGKQRSITHYLLERRDMHLNINREGGSVNAQ